jgi:YbbR domain-containing protein
MLRWLWRNLSSLLLAFVLALTVWVASVSAEDPIEVRDFPSPIPIQVRNPPLNLIMINTPPESARITLRAPRSTWNELVEMDIEVWADLSDVGSGVHRIDVEAQVDRRPVEIIEVEPAAFNLTLETAASQRYEIKVELVGEPAVGYRTSSFKSDPEAVLVFGPETRVGQVESVLASLDISGRSQDVIESVELVPLNANGESVMGVEIQPSVTRVELQIEDLGGYRSVVVSPVIEGEVEPGYQLTGITVSPTLVRVFSSDPQVVNDLSGFVETESVSLEGATADFERRVSLNLPEGVSIVGDQSVLVRVSVSPIQNSITISSEFQFEGLEPGLFAQASPKTVSLILNGPIPLLDDFQADDVRVVLDLLGLSEGTHQVTPDVIVASPEIRVQSILPDTVEVSISGDFPPTPTATPTPPSP